GDLAESELALVGRTSSNRGEPWGTVEDALAHAAAEPDLRDLTALLMRLQRDRGVMAEQLPRAYAAAACAGTWLNHHDTEGFLGQPTWVRGVLETLVEPSGLGDAPISPDVEASLFTELRSRCEDGRSLGLAARQFAY